MASYKTIAPSRALLEALSPIRKRTIRECIKNSHIRRRNALQQCRDMSAAAVQQSETGLDKPDRPRWSETPPAMAAPYPTKVRRAGYKPFECNSDPQKLDEMYVNFLGPNGSQMLSEETKWLAVTHKSFDHGRRGFNDRLAFLGKRTVELQISLGMLTSMNVADYKSSRIPDPHGRVPFEHPATANVEVLSGTTKEYLTHHTQLSRIAEQYSIPSVVRWLPDNPDDLIRSGCDVVYAQTIFAIIGAIAMERGGAVANKIIREKIIRHLGVLKSIGSSSEETVMV